MSNAFCTLGSLLDGFTQSPEQWAAQPVQGLSMDSRAVQPGDLFCAVRGGQRHGLDFLDAVRASGAAAAIWEPPYHGSLPIDTGKWPLLAVPDLGQKLGRIASRFYGEPSQHIQVVGITGTDGKTSSAHFIAQALSDPETGPCGLLGTLGSGVYGAVAAGLHTTPDPIHVQRWLAGLAATGRRYAAMEVSSHALDQGRVNGVRFAVAALTQLSRDHLDYHGTVEVYATAKRRLFTDHTPRWAVLNLDDPFGRTLADDPALQARIIGYGLGERPARLKHFVWGESLRLRPVGLEMTVASSWGAGELRAGLLGRFNVHNLLAALATLLALELPFDEVLARLAHTAPVAGRMERLGGGPGQPLVVIDYAHTPHALEQALTALREHRAGRLICVFGCGGDRDPGKRPLMGAVVERLADQVIVTDDNPRSENPEQIVSAIVAGMQCQDAATVIHDRRQAIRQALAAAKAGETVLIAGKGHENDQIIGAERLPFSDRAVASQFLFPEDSI